MKLRFLFLLAATVAFGGPVVAKEKLATAAQRFGGKTEQAESELSSARGAAGQ